MGKDSAAQLEKRTVELDRLLWREMDRYHPGLMERQQDWLMAQLSRDPVLRSRLLRFMDTLAAIDFDARGVRVKQVFREYFNDVSPRSPVLRSLISACRQEGMPAATVAGIWRYVLRAIAARFVVGRDIPSVMNTLSYLERQGRYATFSLLGEDVLSADEADTFRDRYLALINRLAVHPMAKRKTPAGDPALQLSLKLTALTENFNPADPSGTLERLRDRLETIANRCANTGIGLNLDAEQYEFQELTWRVFSQVFGPSGALGQWQGIGLTVQSYYRDAEQYLGQALHFAEQRHVPFQIRLVKGAYWDYEVVTARRHGWPVPVFEQKEETDRNFQKMAGIILEHSEAVSLALAGHNLRDHAYAEALCEQRSLPAGTIEHQTLTRTAEGVNRAIRGMGWELREYVPSGELVPGMAYLMRRILENTSTGGFLMQHRGKKGADKIRRTQEPMSAPPRSGIDPLDFQNNPAKRLYLAAEREPFAAALQATRDAWGQEYPINLGGQTVHTKQVTASLSPSHPDSTTPVGRVHMAGANESEQAVTIARKGFSRWSNLPPQERARILKEAADLLTGERDSLAAWIVHEGGRTWAEALADVDEAIDHLKYNAARSLALQDTIAGSYQPRGVVAVISPWNFPAALPTGMLSGALAAGNTVILKSAEQTPVIAHRLVDVLHRAGIPQDALIHLPGFGEIGAYLVDSPGVDMVAFTGSKSVGMTIVQQAAAVPLATTVKKAVAEMGGKNAIVVFPDADIDEAVRGILRSAFEHANQKCSACSRVFVHTSIMGRLRERLIHAVASLPVGPADSQGTLVNPLIEPEARDRVLDYARKAPREGQVLIDRTGETPDGLLVGPMVVELSPQAVANSTIAREEIFGPVLALVAFTDEAEMLAQVNGTPYALTAGVFSRSPATVARMIRSIRAGNIYVNRKITGAWVGVEPFGGFQLSGTGPKAGGEDYLMAFLTRRSGYRTGTEPPFAPIADHGPTHLAEQVVPWSTELPARRKKLRQAIVLLKTEFGDALSHAILQDCQVTLAEAEVLAKRVSETVQKVVDAADEIARRQPTITLPGQDNYLDWQTPRGKGFVVTDEHTPPELLAGMVVGPLLAGNGLLLAAADQLRSVSGVLTRCLHRVGVPQTVLAETPEGLPDAGLSTADEMFQFAVTNMSLEQTRRIHQRLSETRESDGQTWIKALISLPEGPQPGEPGFLRLFALPKTIAIRTLRLGADLEFPLSD